ncbi:MAG: hypothetical protein SVC26_02770 [Pseudomonadota bacterium]|nr:hypothetical protein [Pseudomonadota bacterium]
MLSKVSGFFGIAFLAMSLVACGGDSSDGDSSGGQDSLMFSQNEAAQMLVGVYDESYEVDGVIDELYFEITANGEEIVYDYLGDSFDLGPNCYLKETLGRLTPQGDDQYVFTTYSEDDPESYLIELVIVDSDNGELLRFTYIETLVGDFEPEPGEQVVVEYPKTNITVSDFTPICDF